MASPKKRTAPPAQAEPKCPNLVLWLGSIKDYSPKRCTPWQTCRDLRELVSKTANLPGIARGHIEKEENDHPLSR